jgi:hypothetical protein
MAVDWLDGAGPGTNAASYVPNAGSAAIVAGLNPTLSNCELDAGSVGVLGSGHAFSEHSIGYLYLDKQRGQQVQ